jgi:hypothetical protein
MVLILSVHDSTSSASLLHTSPPNPATCREFWQRAEARNKDTAALFDALGLPQYAALEAFVRLREEQLEELAGVMS